MRRSVSAKSHGRVSKALVTVVKTRTVYRKTRMFKYMVCGFNEVCPNFILSVFILHRVLFLELEHASFPVCRTGFHYREQCFTDATVTFGTYRAPHFRNFV